MSQGKIVPIVAAGDEAVRTEAKDAADALRVRVELLEEAAGQLMIKADRLARREDAKHISVDLLNQRITRLELALSHELAVMQGRIAAVESEMASFEGQKEP